MYVLLGQDALLVGNAAGSRNPIQFPILSSPTIRPRQSQKSSKTPRGPFSQPLTPRMTLSSPTSVASKTYVHTLITVRNSVQYSSYLEVLNFKTALLHSSTDQHVSIWDHVVRTVVSYGNAITTQRHTSRARPHLIPSHTCASCHFERGFFPGASTSTWTCEIAITFSASA